MISTNYSVNSIGFTSLLNRGDKPLKRAAEAVVKRSEATSNVASRGCLLKGMPDKVAEKVEKGIEQLGIEKRRFLNYSK